MNLLTQHAAAKSKALSSLQEHHIPSTVPPSMLTAYCLLQESLSSRPALSQLPDVEVGTVSVEGELPSFLLEDRHQVLQAAGGVLCQLCQLSSCTPQTAVSAHRFPAPGEETNRWDGQQNGKGNEPEATHGNSVPVPGEFPIPQDSSEARCRPRIHEWNQKL